MRTRWTLSPPILLAGWLLGLSAAARADDQALVMKGKYLAQAGDCIACHTNPGGALFAGGLAMATPFGTGDGSGGTGTEASQAATAVTSLSRRPAATSCMQSGEGAVRVP